MAGSQESHLSLLNADKLCYPHRGVWLVGLSLFLGGAFRARLSATADAIYCNSDLRGNLRRDRKSVSAADSSRLGCEWVVALLCGRDGGSDEMGLDRGEPVIAGVLALRRLNYS